MGWNKIKFYHGVSMRDIIVAGNWKMNKDAFTTAEFCTSLAHMLKGQFLAGVQVIVAPPYPFLSIALSALADSLVQVCAQDVSPHQDGAYTGEVSATMLASLGTAHCIVGHSERRQYHHESDRLIRDKLLRLFELRITPLLCIGETIVEREADQTEGVLRAQLNGAFEEVTLTSGRDIVIAYEPVWAIGTGKTATSLQAQEAHAFIREWLRDRFGTEIADSIHILYGGSMKPENIGELIAQPDIDGGLIGGASLKIGDFEAMINTALRAGVNT